MGLLINLQDFDAKPAETKVEISVNVEDLPGYAEGYAAAQAAFDAMSDRVDERVAARLDDLAFHFAEARQAVLQSLEPMMSALADHLIPQSIDARFRRQIVDLLIEAARKDAKQPVDLTIHPDQVAAFESLLERTGHSDVRVVPDDGQVQHMALIRHGHTETALDIAGLTAQLISILNDYGHLTQETVQNG